MVDAYRDRAGSFGRHAGRKEYRVLTAVYRSMGYADDALPIASFSTMRMSKRSSSCPKARDARLSIMSLDFPNPYTKGYDVRHRRHMYSLLLLRSLSEHRSHASFSRANGYLYYLVPEACESQPFDGAERAFVQDVYANFSAHTAFDI
jgi:hypothetical protein